METDDVRKIRLIVIGQDPTVKNEASRETIEEPLLKALSIDPKKALVRRYWGYTPDWIRTKAVFSFVSKEENRLNRRLFPFPHQPSLRKRFYSTKLQSYLGYMKNTVTQG